MTSTIRWAPAYLGDCEPPNVGPVIGWTGPCCSLARIHYRTFLGPGGFCAGNLLMDPVLMIRGRCTMAGALGAVRKESPRRTQPPARAARETGRRHGQHHRE